jgi:hypothetical protein
MSGDTDNAESVGKAYDEVCRAYERIDDFRAKLLGFLPAVSGAGLFLLLRNTGLGGRARGKWELLTFGGSFGAIVTLGLLLYEQRGIQQCIRLTTIGSALESKLCVRGRFSRWPHSVRRFINEPTASGFIYSSVIASWVFIAITSESNPAAVAAAVTIWVICFLGTRGFYWWVTWGEEIARGKRPTYNVWSYRCFSQLVTRRIIVPWPVTPSEIDLKWLRNRFGDHKLSSVTFDFLATKKLSPDRLRSAWEATSDISGGRRPMIRRNLLGIALALVEITGRGCSRRERSQKLSEALGGTDLSQTVLEDLELESFDFGGWNFLGCDGRGGSITCCTFGGAHFDGGLAAAEIFASSGLTFET